MGISKAGFKPVEIVERDKWCCDTINRNRWGRKPLVKAWPEPVQSDIRDLDFEGFEGRVDLVSGGPPCQPFSLGGKHRAHADERDMWGEAVRVLREVKPRAFIFENVKGLTRASFAAYFSYIYLQLHFPEIQRSEEEAWADHLARLEQHHTSNSASGLHYKVVFKVLNAADFGVPQRRERVVFVGFRSDTGIRWSFPDRTHSLEALLWDQCRSGAYWDRHRVPKADRDLDRRFYARGSKLRGKPTEDPWHTVRDAIHDLPEPDDFLGGKFLNHRYQPGARSYKGHTGSPLDEPAKTLKAGVHGVPGGENMLLRRDGTVRYFSVRESARLQTFPDEYELHGSWSEAMRQLGNAVPVDLAEVLARNVRSSLVTAAGS
jgi:DNA (cytosine-5)-methyltransferase 1